MTFVKMFELSINQKTNKTDKVEKTGSECGSKCDYLSSV